jgi:pilus assembly protein CpaE
MSGRRSVPAIQVVVLTANSGFRQLVESALGFTAKFALSVVPEGLVSGGATLDVGQAGVVIIDLDSSRREEIVALDDLMARIAGSVPVIVVTDALHESVPRKLVQLRIADFLVKPVTPVELLSACVRVAQIPAGDGSKDARVFTFLPAVGGAGVTTMAIQAALTLHRDGSPGAQSTCLVDLNLAHSACADYLDLKPRLDLSEIEPRPERLDSQLLEVMLSRHSTGISVIAAPNSPTATHSVNPIVVTRLLDLVSSSFDNVVIDMPRTWFPWADDVLCGSNKLFIVSEATVPALRKAKQLAIATSQRLCQCPRPLVIVNRFQRRLFSPSLRRTDIARTLGESFGATIPCNHWLVREAIDRGVPLEEVKRGNNIAVAVKKLILDRDRAGSGSATTLQSAIFQQAA